MKKSKMKINKEQFFLAMKGIETQLEIDARNHEAFSVILSDGFVSDPKNVLYDTIIQLLVELTNDTKGKWIEYFIYELDFGRENWRLKAYDKKDNEIPLSTTEDLWRILHI